MTATRVVGACVLGVLVSLPGVRASDPVLTGDRLYRLTLLRAAPGKYADLLAEVRRLARGDTTPTRAAEAPLVLRHSQGDQWDFLLLVPLAIVGPARAPSDPRASLAPWFSEALVAWQEDELVRGPSFDVIDGFRQAGLYHLEMFDAIAGQQDALVREREMENAYLAGVGRPRNLIFQREFGAAWDAFTVGAYRDWRHYAERDGVTPDRALASARAAGFESDEAIGPYMRTLIISHHDTLTTPIR